MHNIEIWYSIDIPRNDPCYKVNPELWKAYNELRQKLGLKSYINNSLFTEQDVVISIDLELLNDIERN